MFLKWGLILLVPILASEPHRYLNHVAPIPATRYPSATLSCITLLVQRNFRSNSTVGIFTTDVYEEPPESDEAKSSYLADILVKQLSYKRQFSFVSLKLIVSNKSECFCGPEGLSDRRRVDYAILIGSVDDIVTCVKAFCFGALTDGHSRFAVFLETVSENVVERVLEMFWTHRQLHVIVLETNPVGMMDIYMWSPLDVSPRVEIVDQCDGKAFKSNTPLLSSASRHNLNGKSLRIGTVAIPPYVCNRVGGGFAGLDMEIIQAMASALNFTAVYILAKDLKREGDMDMVPWRNNYGNWKILFQRTLSGDVDISFGGLPMRPDLIDDIGYTHPYLRDVSEFLVTQDLVMSNELKSWVATVILQMAVVHICTSLAMQLVKMRIKRFGNGFGDTAILVWAILSEQSGNISTFSPRQVLLWITSAFFVINMNTAYKSFLTAVLARPLYVERVQTVTDMLDSGMPFILKSPLADNDNGSLTPEEHDRILTQMTLCAAPVQTCLVKVLSAPQHCFTSFTFIMRFVEGVLPNRAYHSLERKIAFFDFSFFTPKTSFLTAKLSTVILRCSQAGLIEFWSRKTLRNHRLCDVDDEEWRLLRGVDADRPGFDPEENVPLSIGHLSQSFLLLCFGICMAGVVFVLELLLASNLRRLRRLRLLWPRLKKGCVMDRTSGVLKADSPKVQNAVSLGGGLLAVVAGCGEDPSPHVTSPNLT